MTTDAGPDTRPSLILDFGDPAKLQRRQKFIEIYEPLLVRYVRGKGLTEADARDVVQDVWVRLLKYLPQFSYDPKRRFRGWLWRVTMSAYGEWGDAKGKNPTGGNVETVPNPEDGDPTFNRDFRRHVLQRVIEELKPAVQEKTWRCFAEHVLQGRPAKEVAADPRLQLDITPNAVAANAARVLKKIRALCLEYAEEKLADME